MNPSLFQPVFCQTCKEKQFYYIYCKLQHDPLIINLGLYCTEVNYLPEKKTIKSLSFAEQKQFARNKNHV